MRVDKRLLRLREHLDETNGMLTDSIYVDAVAICDTTLYSKDEKAVEMEVLIVFTYGDTGIEYNELKKVSKSTEFERYVKSLGFKNMLLANVYSVYDVQEREISIKALKSESLSAYKMKYGDMCGVEKLLYYDCELIVTKQAQEIVNIDLTNSILQCIEK